MRFTTVSGSVYEVNTDSKTIRRLNGVQDPTPRQGKDGEWRAYDEIYPDPPQIGMSLVIKWGGDTALMAETQELVKAGGFGMPLTTTSVVVNVEP